MPTNVAPPKNTGGGGFVFEDEVCAWLLASMLVGEPIFGADSGPPVRLDFQTRPDGWFLDDVLVTTAVGATRHRFALSVKSNVQFTATSAPSDFVASAWEQWLHIGSTAFDAARDFMGLVTAPHSGAAASSVVGLSDKARVNDPSLFPTRLATPNWATADERSLFMSFACPAVLGQTTTNVDTARMMQRLRFLQRDFGAVASESQNGALELCRRAVRSHTATDAQPLWSFLREVASELRPRAGSLTLNGLIDRLRTRVLLAEYPDHLGDWATLDARSAREVALVRDSIADRIRLPREVQVAEVLDALTANVRIALIGASGVGKSALARAVFDRRRANGERTLWVDASALDRAADFGAFEISLQLRHPLAELLGMEAGRDPLVIIDGLDRLYSDIAFRNVASLLRAVIGERPATQWRVLAVSQSQEWPRTLDALHRAGAPVTLWSTHQAKSPQPGDLQPVRDAAPALGRLLLQPRVGVILTNLKFLDLVVRRLDGGTQIDASTWVGESSVAEWFWGSEIERGQDRIARGQFARGLAQTQADQLAASVSVDALDPSSLIAAQSLTTDCLLIQVPGDRLAFAHDLYGDWARLRVLLNSSPDLANFLKVRHESPLWHRAIRLLGIHLLEHKDGIAQWKTLMSSFGDGDMAIVRDLLLEAPAFAMNAGRLLDSIFQDLLASEGVLLRRLLTRFLAFATVPNEQMLEIARNVDMDINVARATYRSPHWPYWVDVLAVLHTYRVEALQVAASEISKLVEMWLVFAPPGSIRRREVAELAIMLGQRALDTREVFSHWSHEERTRFYKCALLAAPERPDEVAILARTAAERIPRPIAEISQDPLGDRVRRPFSTGVLRGPWPDGPLARVDDEFENMVLEVPNVLHLYRVRPAIAREVILAALIEGPLEEDWGGGDMHARELYLAHRNDWHPSLFNQGPFLLCLRENFGEGLELIMRLVEFATERSTESFMRGVNELRERDRADGRNKDEVQDVDKDFPSQRLVLHDGTKEIIFAGDAGSYSWSAGLSSPLGYSPLPPAAVTSALMALEQYFYQRLDADEDIIDDIATTLTRCRCVAPLGVLIDVGKRHLSLFNGPLRTLLSAPELYAWDIHKTTHGRIHLMIGAFTKGQFFINLAKKFHEMEHRKRDLRHVAMDRLIASDDIHPFFATVRAWWAKRRSNGEVLIEIADQIDLWLDPSNYEMREDPTHGTVIFNVALERMQASKAEEQQAMNDLMLVTTFPMRCRRILDERRLQKDDELGAIWQSWMRIKGIAKAGPALPGGEDGNGDEYINAITGGIALFLWHAEWLSRNTTRREEVEASLLATIHAPPERAEFASERDISNSDWECFIADAGAMLWARTPGDVRWRRLVANAVFAQKHIALRQLFSRCAEHRATLRGDFDRLRRIAVDWAHVRQRVHMLRGWQPGVLQDGEQIRDRLLSEVESWGDQIIIAFVAGTSPPMPADWNRFHDVGRFVEIDALSQWRPGYRFMDFHVVRYSHEWLPLPDDSLNTEERAGVVQFWRVAFEIIAARPRSDLPKRGHQHPDENESWVIEKIASVVLQLRPDENAEQLWFPIVDLPDGAHAWPKIFLNALHRFALSQTELPAMYGPLVRGIALRAFAYVNGKPRWSLHEEVWDALLGIEWPGVERWAVRHGVHVVAIRDVILLWMNKVAQGGRRLGRFARWLSGPAAAAIRLDTLPWFIERLHVKGGRSVQGGEHAADDLAKLLNVVWDQDQNRLRSTPESFAAFRGLLAWLVEHQNSHGLELQGRIGGLG